MDSKKNDENYKLIADSRHLSKKKLDFKFCVFCGTKDDGNNFTKTAHVIPELLGANDQTYQNECDKCNSIFSKYESHLAVFFRPQLATTKTKGKRKVPKFTSRKDGLNFTTDVYPNSKSRFTMSFNTNLEDFEVYQESKKIRVRFRKTPFRPIYVYKALIRIGLSMLPSEMREKFNHVYEWIQNEGPSTIPLINQIFTVRLNRKKFREPFARLYKVNRIVQENQEYPDCILVVCFANIVIQLYMPFSSEFNALHSKERNLSLELYPLISWGLLNEQTAIHLFKTDLSKFETVTEDQDIWFEFDEYISGSNKSI